MKVKLLIRMKMYLRGKGKNFEFDDLVNYFHILIRN